MIEGCLFRWPFFIYNYQKAMKNKIFFLFFSLFCFAFGYSQVTISPAVFQVNEPITITVSFASATCNTMGANPTKVYMHAGIGDDTNAFGFAVVGNWGLDNGVGLMTNNGNSTWSITLTPSTYFGLNASQQSNATKLGMVFRNATGTQTLKKPTSCGDFIFNVGSFQLTLTTPALNSTTIINPGGGLNIAATNTNGNASYNLKANGVSINTNPSTASYSFSHTGITANQNYELEATQGSSTITKKFSVIVNPGTITEAMPAGVDDGITYNPSDAGQATLVLDAPGKDFVYVAGSFNNWQPSASYAMKKDAATGKFWLTIFGLTAGQDYTYQYWVVDSTPLAGSPALVKTADPYSTLVLSPFDDGDIPAASYPNLPAYPAGQEREVTVLKTNEAPYNWQVTNFAKPAKEDLVVYEVLVRDFDSDRNYQDLIDKMDYFVNLNINAIQLMPVMEYEGNESWGYNTAFHMANDKFYGPANKLREFIDLCHQNGIAVILDVALNHAFGRNPMVRMWMSDADGDGWGGPTAENPYFNVTATHSYSVGNDFNHSQARTKNYVKRVIKHWVQDFKIDGFRWDLTKGFTQNCTGSESCTNAYQQDRVDVLKEYADYSWSLDPTHYTIFEHLGIDSEESQWANYRINETPSKGVMMWGNFNNAYNQLSMGYNTNNDISRMNSASHGFTGRRVIGYAESHDEERLMYKNVTTGNSTNAAHNVKTLNVALSRMPAVGAMSLLVPGPKMIWHFGELGWDLSIFTCNNGTVNTASDATAGDCKLDTKPQPQWANNWLGNANRSPIYQEWAKMIELKKENPVFKGNVDINSGTTLTPKLYIYDNTLAGLKNVVVLSNFNVTSQAVVANFPYTGTWYNLMDGASFNVTNPAMTITIAAGQYKVFGNQPAALNNDHFEAMANVTLYPNPSSGYFTINSSTSKVQVFALTGQLVKSFNAMAEGDQFNINDLAQGLYLVKATDMNNHEKTMRLIKQ
jgi:1,4-alpha-glucan branching enzyme